jgi:16S rRNA (uracil1498-N3)-methyltransferase
MKFPFAPRCFCPDLESLHEAIPDHEFHHLLHVLRLSEGDAVVLFDGKGRYQTAHIVRRDKRRCELEAASAAALAPPPTPQITAGLAIAKHEAWHEQLALCVALGVSVIQPIVSERVEVRIREQEIEEKMSKWERVLIESAKQCASFYLPRLERPLGVEEFVSRAVESRHMIVASLEEGARPLGYFFDQVKHSSFVLLIGPEGDFSLREYALARDHGFWAVSLGSAILRCPVALTVLLSQLRYAFEDWERRKGARLGLV